jgi:hypothetical protein
LIFAPFFPCLPGRFQETLSDVLCRPILLFRAFHFPSVLVSGNFEKLAYFVSFIPPRISPFFGDFPVLPTLWHIYIPLRYFCD